MYFEQIPTNSATIPITLILSGGRKSAAEFFDSVTSPSGGTGTFATLAHSVYSFFVVGGEGRFGLSERGRTAAHRSKQLRNRWHRLFLCLA